MGILGNASISDKRKGMRKVPLLVLSRLLGRNKVFGDDD